MYGLLVKPGCYPKAVEFEDGYKEMQKLVEGNFELVSMYDDVDVFVNEEGKFNGSPPNKYVFVNGFLTDIIFGNILIIDSDLEGNSIPLSDEKIQKYTRIFSSDSIYL